MLYFFFFKQKTAYEMRISDWSSDVCSSDLRVVVGHALRNSLIPVITLIGLQIGFLLGVSGPVPPSWHISRTRSAKKGVGMARPSFPEKFICQKKAPGARSRPRKGREPGPGAASRASA